MLIDTNLRDYFWPFAVLTTAHIKQCVPHSSLPTSLTPFQLWFSHKPDLSHLRPFGTHCTARIISNHNSKFKPRGESGRFLSYAKEAKGYLIWVTNAENNGGTLKVRRDITFHDFPTPPPPPQLPHNYCPLWENIEFPDRIQMSDDVTSPLDNTPVLGTGTPPGFINNQTPVSLYVHAW